MRIREQDGPAVLQARIPHHGFRAALGIGARRSGQPMLGAIATIALLAVCAGAAAYLAAQGTDAVEIAEAATPAVAPEAPAIEPVAPAVTATAMPLAAPLKAVAPPAEPIVVTPPAPIEMKAVKLELAALPETAPEAGAVPHEADPRWAKEVAPAAEPDEEETASIAAGAAAAAFAPLDKPAAKRSAKKAPVKKASAATAAVTKGAGKVRRSVNMRAKPASGSKVLGVIPANSKVQVIGCTYWCEVRYNGKRGFIYKSFLGQ